MGSAAQDWITKALFNAGTTATTAILSVGATPGQAAVLAVGGTFANLVYDLACLRSPRRGQDFVTELGGGDAPRALAALQARKDDPVVQDVVLESARALAEALSDCVIPALAKLTGEYLSNERRADAFFRGVRRVLSDLDEDEFRALQTLLEAAAAVKFQVEPWMVELYCGPGPQGVQVYAAGHAIETVGPPGPIREGRSVVKPEQVPIGQFEHLPRLFNLLKGNDLATESVGRLGVAGTMIAMLPVERMRRLQRLLG